MSHITTAKALQRAVLALAMVSPCVAYARFNTIRRKDFKGYEILIKSKEGPMPTDIQLVDSTSSINREISSGHRDERVEFAMKRKNCRVRKKHLGFDKKYPGQQDCSGLPELTVANLLDEIRKNGILHEKIVLAQAILETGWFTSQACRIKNNLFGLTNPRTGKYYEFSHWTESVKAYYSKVQYKYKGGNYLLWLEQIGYAEDPNYVQSLIRILRRHIL